MLIQAEQRMRKQDLFLCTWNVKNQLIRQKKEEEEGQEEKTVKREHGLCSCTSH